jgi:hypothetical protein
VKVGENNAQMLDLIHNGSEKQLRQVIFIKEERVVIFTCRDHKLTFLDSLKNCNDIVRTFRWTL